MFGRRLLPMDRSIEPEQAADQSFDLKRALA
jgi:3-phenylpropionate/trans-cinnamate dioxygenase ferredoxin reductase subunit